MNFFFSLQNVFLNCELTIPKFRNKLKKSITHDLFSLKINNNSWQINNEACYEDEDFFIINNNQLSNNKNFFLAKKNEIKNFNINELLDFNHYTNTDPEYRSNLKVYNSIGGFSSYQSEYPYSMTKKMGSMVSPIFNLLNKKAEKNYIFIKNIFYKPINEFFYAYLIDIIEKKILIKKKLFTNTTNEIFIPNEFIRDSVYIFTDKFTSIPIYVSIQDGHISMEHTHPPHLYLWGEEKFNLIKKFKDKIREIIT